MELGADFALLVWRQGPLDPTSQPVAKVKTMNIRKIVIKLENGINQAKVERYLRYAQEQMSKDPRYGALQIYYDVDPM